MFFPCPEITHDMQALLTFLQFLLNLKLNIQPALLLSSPSALHKNEVG